MSALTVMSVQFPQSPVTPNMYPLIPPTTGPEGSLQLTVKDGGPELENVITTGPGAEGITVETLPKINSKSIG